MSGLKQTILLKIDLGGDEKNRKFLPEFKRCNKK